MIFYQFYYKSPHLTNVELAQSSEFMPTFTDAGLCHVLNGDSIADTYSPTERIKQLDVALGFGNDFSHRKNISGSGFLNKRSFWFDVGKR